MLGGHGDGPLLVLLRCTGFFYEGISWLLLYHTSTYKSLRSSIDKASKKLKSMKSNSSSSASGAAGALSSSLKKPSSRAKKMDRVETSLKDSTHDLSLSKFKFGAVIVAILFIIFALSPLFLAITRTPTLPSPRSFIVVRSAGAPTPVTTCPTLAALSNLSLLDRSVFFHPDSLSKFAIADPSEPLTVAAFLVAGHHRPHHHRIPSTLVSTGKKKRKEE